MSPIPGRGQACDLVAHITLDPVSFPHGYSFKPGVVTTVEPGYYKEGDFGVRTESLFVCKEVEVCPALSKPEVALFTLRS